MKKLILVVALGVTGLFNTQIIYDPVFGNQTYTQLAESLGAREPTDKGQWTDCTWCSIKRPFKYCMGHTPQ
ncbi:hypothetical protein [Chryseobacterium cucumeris]|uniref:hypothetical protein n=1 Tax=Chryseobacterium cucumeris TaxID=1813611 RepID=UPI0023F40ACA|nr:hypothetical protein [Chryseobacterium cucumeris]